MYEKRGYKYQSDGNFVPYRTRWFLFTRCCPLLRLRIGFNTVRAKQCEILALRSHFAPLPSAQGKPGRVQSGGTGVCSTGRTMKLMELCADESEAGCSRACPGLSCPRAPWPGRAAVSVPGRCQSLSGRARRASCRAAGSEPADPVFRRDQCACVVL